LEDLAEAMSFGGENPFVNSKQQNNHFVLELITGELLLRIVVNARNVFASIECASGDEKFTHSTMRSFDAEQCWDYLNCSQKPQAQCAMPVPESQVSWQLARARRRPDPPATAP